MWRYRGIQRRSRTAREKELARLFAPLRPRQGDLGLIPRNKVPVTGESTGGSSSAGVEVQSPSQGAPSGQPYVSINDVPKLITAKETRAMIRGPQSPWRRTGFFIHTSEPAKRQRTKTPVQTNRGSSSAWARTPVSTVTEDDEGETSKYFAPRVPPPTLSVREIVELGQKKYEQEEKENQRKRQLSKHLLPSLQSDWVGRSGCGSTRVAERDPVKANRDFHETLRRYGIEAANNDYIATGSYPILEEPQSHLEVDSFADNSVRHGMGHTSFVDPEESLYCSPTQTVSTPQMQVFQDGDDFSEHEENHGTGRYRNAPPEDWMYGERAPMNPRNGSRGSSMNQWISQTCMNVMETSWENNGNFTTPSAQTPNDWTSASATSVEDHPRDGNNYLRRGDMNQWISQTSKTVTPTPWENNGEFRPPPARNNWLTASATSDAATPVNHNSDLRRSDINRWVDQTCLNVMTTPWENKGQGSFTSMSTPPQDWVGATRTNGMETPQSFTSSAFTSPSASVRQNFLNQASAPLSVASTNWRSTMTPISGVSSGIESIITNGGAVGDDLFFGINSQDSTSNDGFNPAEEGGLDDSFFNNEIDPFESCAAEFGNFDGTTEEETYYSNDFSFP